MKMIVGLGNPGRRYEGTRHNVGFDAVLALAKAICADRSSAKFDADYFDLNWSGERLLLVRPLTFMNLSGQSVRKFVDFFRIPLSEILVICDDLALPTGTIRMRPGGSSGGQKGLQNICDLLGSTDVPRLRIGIGSTPDGWDTANFVLSKLSGDDSEEIKGSLVRATEAVQCWIQQGIVEAMNRFNGSTPK
jgi:PTH1 family peptidyl-tRNA hydrolase